MVQTDKKYPNKDIIVSVIVPCFNEENTIQLLLQALLNQNFQHERMEVVIADALSEDQTIQKILEFSAKKPPFEITIIENTKRTIPAAINLAAENSRGKYLIRLDAHSIPDKDYICTSIELLESGKAQNVGGTWNIQPGDQSCVAKAIARAASHLLGAGDARYRISSKSGFVDTVPFGAFSKETFNQLGGFNEDLLSNEDYEFNARLIKNGGSVWLDSRIQSTYFARKNFKKLADQYKRYGFWKYQMLRLYPDTLRMRQVIPPVFVIALMGLLFLSLFWSIARIILGLVLAIYLGLLLVVSVFESIKRREVCYLYLFVAFAIMHFCWGSSFIYGMISYKKKRIN